MALKYIPASWQGDMRTNFNHKHDFYFNPRGRVFPAMTSAGISYVKNDLAENMRGTYRAQTGATTDLTYLYKLPQRFIIEGWFKPGFAYDVATDQPIFRNGGAGYLFSLEYNVVLDSFLWNTFDDSGWHVLQSDPVASSAELQDWVYVRCFMDNIAKLKGFYCTIGGVVFSDQQGTPSTGAFSVLNTISILPGTTAESSYWLIHELDETLETGVYKTYQADRQVMFDLNGTTLGRERIRIPTVHDPADERGVKLFSLSKSVENPMTGSAGANTAALTLVNVTGAFSDDQYDAFDPYNGRYNGPERYLQNRVQFEIESRAPSVMADYDYQGYCEPLFIGRATPGAFKRNSPNKFYGDVKVMIEDGISELGETKLRQAHGYDSYDLSDPASESTSLLHTITRLVTRKEIRNYALNSSFENATIGNSWLNDGMATLERSSTVAQFGTYSMKCIADTIGDIVTQVIKFETVDLIDVGDTFNFSAFAYQETASAVRLTIEELTSAGALVGTGTSVDCGTETGRFVRYDVARTIQAATCTQLRLTFYAVATSTFYIDGVMLTRGIDPIDYFLANANDGASGIGSADNAATTTYDTVAIDAEAVAVEHPYALVEKGTTAWQAIKKIGDASIASYTGMSPDGVLLYKVRYNGADRPNHGNIEDFGGIATNLGVQSANSVKVHGVIIKKEESQKSLWNGAASGLFGMVGDEMKHPLDDGAFLTVQGTTVIEMKYAEDI